MISINAYKCACGNFESKTFLEDDERGELVCRNCGRVSQLVIDSKPASQANEPLGSVIGPSFEENSNREFAASLQRIGNHLLPNYTELKWKELIEELSDKAGIAHQVREAVIQYHHHNRNKFKHANRRELATALLYVHMKNYLKGPRSLKEICSQLDTNLVRTRRYITLIAFENGLKPVYGARMNLDRHLIEKSFEYAFEFQESAFSGASPRTIAASALYLATRKSGHRYTQRDLATTLGLAEYSVREISGKMKRFLGLR